MKHNPILFFSILILLFSCIFPAQVSSELTYYDFYREYILDTWPAEIIDRTVDLTGSVDSGLGFLAHSRVMDAGNNYTYLEWRGVVFRVSTLPIISFSFRVVEENLVPRPGYECTDYCYSILSMTHWRDQSNALVLVVKINPANDPGHSEVMTISWLYASFDPATGFRFKSDVDAGTSIVFDGGTMYNHDVRLTIIPVIYSWNTSDGVRALFGFYTIVAVDNNVRADFQVAWRQLYFNKYNVTEFHRYVQSFYEWYVCLGLGSFLYRVDIGEVVPDVGYAAHIEPYDSWVKIRYSNVYVANTRLAVDKYFADWMRGLLPEYAPEGLIDLRSKLYGLDPSLLVFMAVAVATPTVLAYIGYRYSRSPLLAYALAVAGLAVAASLICFRTSILVVAGMALLLPFIRG